MFQQVPVTRAPCFEALSLTVSPLESRGWLTCKQPCQGKTLKSLVGGKRVLWSTTYTVIPGGLRATHSGGNRSEEAFSLSCSVLTGLATGLTPARLAWLGRWSGGSEGGGGTGGWISPAEPCVPLLGYVTGAGTWVGCWVWRGGGGGRREADFLLRWQDDEEEVKNQMNWLDLRVLDNILSPPSSP